MTLVSLKSDALEQGKFPFFKVPHKIKKQVCVGTIRIFHFLNFQIWYEIQLCAADFPLQLRLFHDDLNFLTFHVETRHVFYQVDVFIYCIYFREKGKCYLPTTWCRSPLLNFSPPAPHPTTGKKSFGCPLNLYKPLNVV